MDAYVQTGAYRLEMMSDDSMPTSSREMTVAMLSDDPDAGVSGWSQNSISTTNRKTKNT